MRVNIANAESLKARRDAHVRFMRGFRETIDSGWPRSEGAGGAADYRKTSIANAKRLRDEFFAKSALDPDTIKGMDQLMVEAELQHLAVPLTSAEHAELVQVPLR